MELLDTPLRVTWDLHGPAGPLAADAALRVADALVDAGVFFVTLDERPLAHAAIADILAVLAKGGCRTLAVSAGSDQELRTLDVPLALHDLLLDVEPCIDDGRLDLDALDRRLQGLRQREREPGLLLVPRATNLHLLPDLLAFCRSRQVGRFKLPNIKIDARFWHSPADRLRPEDLERLRPRLGADPATLRAGVALEVHDLFLWELLFPSGGEGRGEYVGCQAANSLAHIDVAAELYPCSSWPERLGSLLHQSVAAIWQSPGRFRVRNEIEAEPAGCAGCRDYPLCFGGCRGLSRALSHEGSGRDPLCRGPRG